MINASLVVVGSGIKFMSHLTVESKAYIEQSQKVLYLVNEPAIEEWIHKINPQAESLDPIYTQHNFRIHSYQAITNYILDILRQKKHICVVLYGHPTIFAKPALDAVIVAKKEGYYAKILPGISAEDCLFADLLIDPGSHGCLSFEATDFLIHTKLVDTSCHLILWQASIIGALTHPESHDNTKGSQLLLNYLTQHYDLNHPIIVYTAAQYPGLEPIIEQSVLKNLLTVKQSRTSLLYIPPVKKRAYDESILRALEIKISDFN
jgi:tetrapyrrole methylase family protein/MazG family protein